MVLSLVCWLAYLERKLCEDSEHPQVVNWQLGTIRSTCFLPLFLATAHARPANVSTCLIFTSFSSTDHVFRLYKWRHLVSLLSFLVDPTGTKHPKDPFLLIQKAQNAQKIPSLVGYSLVFV